MSQLKKNGLLRWKPSYLRNRGHLSKAQKRSIKNLWPLWGVSLHYGERLDLSSLFRNDQPVCLEIGFGTGLTLVQRAKMQPQTNFVGVEVHKPGIANALKLLSQNQCQNVRLIKADALLLLYDHLYENTFQDISIFFPDPWPRVKDHHRRIVRKETLQVMGQLLQTEGVFYFATDIAEYAQQVLELLQNAPSWHNESPHFSPKPPWRSQTKYEREGIDANRNIWDIRFSIKK